jgi:hypothetical protein
MDGLLYYKCKHFQICELVDQATYREFGEDAWSFFRPNLLISLDNVREYYDIAVTVNNWRDGGQFSERGLRILNPGDKAIYSPYSEHAHGNAVDYDVKGKTAEQVRQDILNHKDDDPFKLIMALEKGTNWVHMDCRNVPDRIVLFNS